MKTFLKKNLKKNLKNRLKKKSVLMTQNFIFILGVIFVIHLNQND